MAVIRYDRGASAPQSAGRTAPIARKQITPMRATPALGFKPMGQEDTDAGTAAAGGFTYTLDFGSTGGGGGGSNTAAINTGYKLTTDKATARRNRAQADYIRGILGLKPGEAPQAGAYDKSISDLLLKVDEEEKRQLGDIATLYGTAGTSTTPGTGLVGNVTTAYGTAVGQATAGYDALKKWLTDNAPKAYTDVKRAIPTGSTNALAAYQAAQGVSSAPTDAAVQMMNAVGGGGAGQFNTLLDTLAGAQRAAQESRLAEEGMARLATGNQMSAAQAAALAQLATQRATAESGIRSQFGGTRLSAEQARITRRQVLEDALRELIGY